jgi:hypothetical protein
MAKPAVVLLLLLPLAFVGLCSAQCDGTTAILCSGRVGQKFKGTPCCWLPTDSSNPTGLGTCAVIASGANTRWC